MQIVYCVQEMGQRASNAIQIIKINFLNMIGQIALVIVQKIIHIQT